MLATKGLWFGFAVDETPELAIAYLLISHKLVRRLAELRKSGEIGYLRPDAKSSDWRVDEMASLCAWIRCYFNPA